jgi:putative ABC transport system substrate-binding protein
MKRREFTAFLGGAVAWPLTVRAQQPSMPVIGFLHATSEEQNVKRMAAFRKGLSDAGFVEGHNVAILYRWANGHEDRLPEMAADLIRQRVNVIAAPNTPAALVVKRATPDIPIVFATGGDPVEMGLVASISRPGGDVTGATSLNADVAAKRFGVLRELVPKAAHYFSLVNPTSALTAAFIKDLEVGAESLGIHVDLLRASTADEIDAGFAALPHQPGNVMVFGPDQYFYSRRTQLAALLARYEVPAIFDVREYVDAGGLASYGADFADAMELAGGYTGRILKGEKPANLPVVRAAKFELVINEKTAKALGIAIPATLLALADDVVQ